MTAHVCPPEHKHALNTTCYTAHKCRCGSCRAANTARCGNARRLQAYGRWEGRVDPRPVVEHIQHLQGFGYSYEAIARVSGVNSRSLYLANTGRLKFFFGRTARAVLSVKPDLGDLDDAHLVPTRGAVRRVQALGTRGWTMTAIAAEVGITRSNLSHLFTVDSITLGRHRAIADVYDRLWNKTPVVDGPWDARSIGRTLERAAAERWVAPLAWDDIDNDPEPQAGEDVDVDEIAVELAVNGVGVMLTRPERHIAVRALHSRNYSDDRISRLLGVASKTIARDRRELGLPGVTLEEALAA